MKNVPVPDEGQRDKFPVLSLSIQEGQRDKFPVLSLSIQEGQRDKFSVLSLSGTRYPPTGGKKRVSLTVNVGKEGGRKLTPSSSLPTDVDKKKFPSDALAR